MTEASRASWSPDPDFERVALMVAARASEEALTEREQKLGLLNAEIAGRRISGGPNVRAARSTAEECFQAWGARSLKELLELFQHTFGQVPAESVPWIRTFLTREFDGFARGMIYSLEEAYRRHQIPASGADEGINRVAAALRRDVEIALGSIELRGRLRSIATDELPSAAAGDRSYDVFVSYASEDLVTVAPLAAALRDHGLSVWFDRFALKVGMSVYATIDEGLRSSRYGVVFLSRAFFAKKWPQSELHALAALAASEGTNKILPVWHDVGRDDIARYSPLLVGVHAAQMSEGLEAVVAQIVGAVS